jgi:trans-2,3-dihydro-3-hydroxyanthranilate isomerase
MRSYRYLHLDVFTDRLFGGNQLAVFLDGRGLSGEAMQSIAKEMNFSESTFVLPTETAGTDCRVRIFTPDEELPMAGHPTVGTTFALARAGAIARGRDRIVLGLTIGPTPVSLVWREDELGFVWMSQRSPTFGEPVSDPAGAAAVLRLSGAAVTGTGLPVQTVTSGLPFLFVPLATRGAVDSAGFDSSAYDEFIRDAGLPELPIYLFSAEQTGDKATVYSRMFAPGMGISEDPATGGACGPLGAYLVTHRVVAPEKAGSILNLQGVKMGRPSYIHISVGMESGDIQSVRVGGEAVVAGEGTLYI